MRLPARLSTLWRRLLQRKRADRELDEELASFIDLAAEEKLHAGVPAAQARRAARLELGGAEQVKEAVRSARFGASFGTLARDVRHGLRLLARAPGFTAVVVLSLGLGVGGTTAVFSVVNAVLLRPLPYADADRLHLVRIWWGDFSASLSPADLAALRASSDGLAEVGSYFHPDNGFALPGPDGPQVVEGALLTREFTRVLGVAPLLGRAFSPDAGAREALIAESFWRERYGGARDVLGRSLEVDGDAFTVVGVMPEGFNVPGQRDGVLWLLFEPRPPTRRGAFYLNTVARLPPGVAAEQAAARLSASVAPVLRERFGVTDEWRYGLRPLKDALVGDARATLGLLFAAGGLVLLIGVLNFANLLLARGLTRRQELSLRAALGAGRRRLVAQLIAESATVGLLGGALGLVLALVALRFAGGAAAGVVPRMNEVSLDAAAVAFAVVVGVGAGLAAGVFPALRLRWSELALELREGGRVVGGTRRHGRARRVLVAGELALTLTLLASAALLVKSLTRLQAVDPGFDPAGLLSFRLVLPEAAYPDSATVQFETFITSLEGRLRALPGVRSVAFASALPPDRLQISNNYTVEGAIVEQGGAAGVAEWPHADVHYFRTLGIPVVRGRVFEATDREGAPLVAVVNESFVRRHYADGSAIGKRLKGGDWSPDAPWLTIIGVVRDVPYVGGIWTGSSPTVYTAFAQNLRQRSPFVVVKGAGDAAALTPAVTAAVHALDPRLPLRDVATMRARLRDSEAAPRLRGVLFTSLAAIAVILAVTGIYGILAYEASSRRREMAVKRALGAPPGRVAGDVVRSGMGLVTVGIVVGLGAALLTARALGSLLYGVSPSDPGIMAAAAGALAGAALLACAIPAARAARVEPMSVLRED